MWTTNIIKTPRGKFEYFLKGEGPPLCVTHLYSEYNDNGNFIYCGKHDVQCPYIFSREIANLIPNATLTKFEESNHNPFVEEIDKFNQFVKNTL